MTSNTCRQVCVLFFTPKKLRCIDFTPEHEIPPGTFSVPGGFSELCFDFANALCLIKGAMPCPLSLPASFS